jgi:xanthine dehydrogenase accessory factor
MLDQFLQKTRELMAQGTSFAVATVVHCLPPTSGKPGDKAIILADGKLWGWIGGGCAQPVVAKEALKALADGKPRLVRISPSPDASEEGIVDYTMTCHSGGAMDIYIEPVLPRPHLVILGRSPIAQALARLGSVVGYAISVVVGDEVAEPLPDIEVIQSQDYNLDRAKVTGRTFIVVSTQGEGDEEALEQALKTEAAYIAFVASKTKAEKVFDYLKTQGVAAEKIKRVQAPAGLAIRAKSPEEIAVSILAQIIQVRGQGQEAAAPAKSSAALPIINSEARDPVCGMSVNPSKARHKSEYEGTAFYFCCAGCKQAFDRKPQRYLAAKV